MRKIENQNIWKAICRLAMIDMARAEKWVIGVLNVLKYNDVELATTAMSEICFMVTFFSLTDPKWLLYSTKRKYFDFLNDRILNHDYWMKKEYHAFWYNITLAWVKVLCSFTVRNMIIRKNYHLRKEKRVWLYHNDKWK